MLNYMNDRGYAAVGFEGGQNEAPSSIEHNEAALWTILVAAGCLRRIGAASRAGAEPTYPAHRRRSPHPGGPLSPCNRAGRPFRHGTRLRQFSAGCARPLLARDRRGEVRAGESGRILLPLYQSQGADGFFLVREISPRWLAVSALVRRLRLERLLPVLPGIRRDPQRPETLIVDPGVARWLATDFFHLLGYRRGTPRAGKIVVSRRPHDVES